MEKDLSRRGVLRLGAGVALGGIATAFVPTIANAVETRTARAMTPPQSATKTFSMLEYGDRRDLYRSLVRSPSPEVRTVSNKLKPTNKWTTKFHVFTVNWTVLEPTEILIPTSLHAPVKAEEIATHYARTLGLLPRGLRSAVRTINLNPGSHNYTGGGGNITLYTDVSYRPERLPNSFAHEAAHSVNNELRKNAAKLARWNAAVDADRRAGGPGGGFISKYAADNPTTEDFGESMVAWLSVRYHADRLNAIDPRYVPYIRSQIANRIDFFRSLGLDLAPLGG